MIIQMWAFGRLFLENGGSVPVIPRRTTNLTSMIKCELSSTNQYFGKLLSALLSLTCSQHLKNVLMTLVMSNECDLDGV